MTANQESIILIILFLSILVTYFFYYLNVIILTKMVIAVMTLPASAIITSLLRGAINYRQMPVHIFTINTISSNICIIIKICCTNFCPISIYLISKTPFLYTLKWLTINEGDAGCLSTLHIYYIKNFFKSQNLFLVVSYKKFFCNQKIYIAI